MNLLLAIAISLVCSAQENHTYEKIEVVAEGARLPTSSSPGLNLNTDFKQSTDESLLEIPNVNFAGGTNRPRYLQIRGQGETSMYENTPSHSVGMFVDDIDLTGMSSSWVTMNTSQMNVMKGPQSTQWGGSSIGGLLDLRLNDIGSPAQAKVTYQSQKAVEIGTEFDIAKTSRLFFDHNSDPGFYKNTFRGDEGAARNEYYVSLKNNILSSENWQITSSHIGMKTNNGYDVWSLNRPNIDDDFETLSDQQGEDTILLNGHALHVERKLSPTDSLVSISSIARSESTYSYDADWGNNAYWNSIPGWNANYDYFDEFLRDRTAWHQKVFYKHGHSTAGAHLYGLDEHSDANHYKNKAFKEGLTSDFNSKSAALYADLNLPMTEGNSVLLGGRYEIQNTKYSDTFLPGVERTYRFDSFLVGLQHDVSPELSTQAIVSRGFKSPGVNIDSSLPAQDRFYQPEYAMNYEVGFDYKTSLLRLSTHFFLTHHQDKQVKVSRQDDPTDPSSFTYFTTNAARAISHGLESSAQLSLGTWLTELQLGLLKAEFRDYFFENQNLRGHDLAHAPSWNFALGITKSWSERFSTNISLLGKNDFAFSNNHTQRSQPYRIVDLGMTYRRGKWATSAWVKNVFDERYATRGFFFANEPPDWENKLYVHNGPPRHAGLSVSYLF